MVFAPSKNPKVRYSPAELRILDILSRQGRSQPYVDSEQLTMRFYNYKRRRPRNARIIVRGAATSLVSKVKANRESFVIMKTERCGPYPVAFAVEERP